MGFRAVPVFDDGEPEKTGVLLVNLGTPSAPTAPAVRRYLGEFLADPRVVEIPRLLWLALLYGIILNVRPRRSAAKYAQIWTPEGSPLAVHTARQTALLRQTLGGRYGPRLQVEYAMRYGEPSVAAVLAELERARCTRVVVIPLYPQYAASSTASVVDAVCAFMTRTRVLPALRVVRDFHDEPRYIDALTRRVRAHWGAHGGPAHLVMSFHGLPRYVVEKRDPYRAQCFDTARLLAERLGLAEGAWTVSFQSRFGRTAWLEPYTVDVLRRLARQGVGRLDVIAPGFVADCLETLEEIGIEGRALFLAEGGREFHAIPCLNEDGAWIEALAGIAERELEPAGEAIETEAALR